jgi:hypothetical protein
MNSLKTGLRSSN